MFRPPGVQAAAGIIRDVRFVMSAALLFINYISHKVKTCVRRNFKSYPVTMNNIVLTSSALWLFDVIKNVMCSNVSGKKKKGNQSSAKARKPPSL